MNVRGVAYFGSRIRRHVRIDLGWLAAAGFTDVLHTFSEEDLRHYKGQVRGIVADSHDAGLRVTLAPFGVGGAFGGEAASYWLAERPDLQQRDELGQPLGALCLARPDVRDLLGQWLTVAAQTGADRVMWDEPHWKFPVTERARCHCDWCCRDPSVSVPWRSEAVLTDLLAILVKRSASVGLDPVVCLLPDELGGGAIRDWATVAQIPGLVELTSDPYWRRAGLGVNPFVSDTLRRLQRAVAETDVDVSCWIQGFGLDRTALAEIDDAVATARALGVGDLWTWGFEAADHMTSLEGRDAEAVWPAIVAALTRGSDAP